MPKPKGGRGHAAPYDTKLMRIPIPLADQVQQLIERYQDYLSAGGEAFAPPPLLDAISEDRALEQDLTNIKLLESERDKYQLDADKAVNKFNELSEIYEELNLEWVKVKADLWPEKRLREIYEQKSNELEQQCGEQEVEINNLHQKNGDLNLEVQILRQQLKDAANPVNEFELKEAKASAEYWEATAKDFGTQADKLANKLLLSKEIENPTQKTDIKAVNNLQPLSQRQLGKRLGVSHTAIGKKQKQLTSLAEWTRERDPEGIAWEYDATSKLFQPLKLQ